MSQPLNRNCRIPALGDLDKELGEFWVENPFMMMGIKANLSSYERNRAFINVDGKSFIDASFASAMDLDSDSRSVVTADFDRDGATDVLVGSAGGGPLRLFLNQFPRQNSIRLNLIGTTSNRSGIGARVIAQVGDRKIVRDAFPTNGFMGQGPPEILLGLGSAKQIDQLEIRWPSGKSQKFANIPLQPTLNITEGKGLAD